MASTLRALCSHILLNNRRKSPVFSVMMLCVLSELCSMKLETFFHTADTQKVSSYFWVNKPKFKSVLTSVSEFLPDSLQLRDMMLTRESFRVSKHSLDKDRRVVSLILLALQCSNDLRVATPGSESETVGTAQRQSCFKGWYEGCTCVCVRVGGSTA